MECNKDEAERSKGIAEAKFLQNDFVGAKKFAFKAKQLFPALEGLAQLIAVLDVHLTAHVKLQGGETNWYGILQADPRADESTIRKQYRRLALILHPDKNKSVGAEAAFKYISEAWGVLSDKTKKAAHDSKLHAKPPSSKMAPTMDPLSNATRFCRPPTASASQHQPARASRPTMPLAQPPPPQGPPPPPPPPPSPPPPPPPPPPQLSSTFWTACPSCRMQFEYQRIYVNKTLCCSICYKGFYAIEVPFVNGITLWSLKDQHVFNADAMKSSKSSSKAAPASNTSFPWSCFGNGTTNPPGQPQMSTTSSKEDREAHQPTTMNQTEMNFKEEDKETDNLKAKLAAHLNEFRDQLREKSKGLSDLKTSLDTAFNAGCEVNAAACRHSEPYDIPMSERETAPGLVRRQMPSDLKCGGKENLAAYGKASLGQRDGHEPVKSSPDTRHATRSASSKHREEHSASPAKRTKTDGATQKAVDLKGGRSEGCTSAPMGAGSSSLSSPSPADRQFSESGVNVMDENANIMNVPDADFYDFDQDRTENHFCAGQIWAVYDDDDALPRYYAQISKVYSYKPFKLQIAWLEPLSPSDEIRNWINSGFSYTCGEFKLGTTIIVKTVNMFSHIVTFEKRSKGGFKIYPRKGDVWALYKDWKNTKQNNAMHDFAMAEVLTDYADEVGVQVSFLTKIEGFKSIFQRQLGVKSVHWVVPGDLRRFSHQIPTNRLMSDVPGVQEGCLELDPASTPLNLIAGH